MKHRTGRTTCTSFPTSIRVWIAFFSPEQVQLLASLHTIRTAKHCTIARPQRLQPCQPYKTCLSEAYGPATRQFLESPSRQSGRFCSSRAEYTSAGRFACLWRRKSPKRAEKLDLVSGAWPARPPSPRHNNVTNDLRTLPPASTFNVMTSVLARV